MTELLDQQKIIPNEEDKFHQFFTPSINHNRIIFRATGHKGQEGIYVYKKGKVLKIISNQDKINDKQIQSFRLSRHALDKNTIAMLINFKDARSSIYTAKFE